jgi:histidine kinase/DNA gyrase B/HSP90-like ATPase
MAFRPLQYKEVKNFINRAYNECQAFQWARETLKNSIEAQATKIHFGVEFQAVENLGVYRRLIADNGKGMTAKQLYEYFSNAGTGDKQIGGEHENFGIGAKISLMPWNSAGLIIVSWVGGEASMIWIEKSQKTGEYGLHSFEQFDDENVVRPFDDPEHGCDWRKVKPDFIEEHGTVLVLLGNSLTDDTVLGDPNRPDEQGASMRLIHYLNQRFWTLPDGVEISVNRFLNDTNKDSWPRNAREGRQTLEDGTRKGGYINLYGGRIHVTQQRRKEQAEIASGVVKLYDGTQAHWYLLKKGKMPDPAQGPNTSFIGILYNDELYQVTWHHAVYRTMGITPQAVRTKLWVIFEPPVDNPPKVHGVYPESARSALKHSGTADRSVPMNEWLADFAKRLPEEIEHALSQAFGEHKEDSSLTSKLMERLSQYLHLWGKKFKQRKLLVVEGGGNESVDTSKSVDGGIGLIIDSGEDHVPPEHGQGQSSTGTAKVSTESYAEGIDRKNAKQATPPREPPRVVWRPKTDFDDPENHFAMWVDARNEILLNEDHRIIAEQIERWQARYPDHVAETVATKVREVYKAAVLSVFLATEALSMGKQAREERFRTPDALTLALMGYFREDEILRQQLLYLGKAKAVDSAA